jgi:4-hydroxybenzoate polyprenyltransferase
VSILARLFDERFLAHRQRSTSLAGIVSALSSLLLFAYRFYVKHVANWDLLAIGAIFVVLKMSLMVWYAVRD